MNEGVSIELCSIHPRRELSPSNDHASFDIPSLEYSLSYPYQHGVRHDVGCLW